MPDGKRKQQLTRYVHEVLRPSLEVLPCDREAALRHAEERVRLTSQGRTPPFRDGQIAAIATAVIVSQNGKIDYCFMSEALISMNPAIYPRKGTPVPPGTITKFMTKLSSERRPGARATEDIDGSVWIDWWQASSAGAGRSSSSRQLWSYSHPSDSSRISG